MSDITGFRVGIEFGAVLSAISKQIYETQLAFIRENVQNAVDALRLQAARQGTVSSDPSLKVNINARELECDIGDNGIGMTLDDLRDLFWTIGASGKRTEEARAAGCVGMFGIGGFANFGVCDALRVTSQAASDEIGHWTELSRQDIEGAGGAIPSVRVGETTAVAPRGTVVHGVLGTPIDVSGMSAFVRDFVQYADEHVYFNGELLSRRPFQLPSERGGELQPLTAELQRWTHGNVEISGRLFETPGHLLQAEILGLTVSGTPIRIRGVLRFEHGPIEVLKRGFKICSTAIGTDIGASGVIDCDRLSPTAGRDSLDPQSSALLSAIVSSMEHAAVVTVLGSSERITQHSRIFRFVRRQGLVSQMGNVTVDLADGSESRLDDIRRKAAGEIHVFFATSKNRALSQILQARGHVVVQLPGDHDKQAAIRDYLVSFCGAQPFDGRIECAEQYNRLTTFEHAFLSELELTITGAYDVADVSLIPGRLTEDVPVYAVESTSKVLRIYVDVRHPEITKLERLGIGGIFYSMVAAFVREYLGSTLRSRSPKFFGSGAVNLDFLAKRKSELWVLMTADIEILRRGSQREVVTQADVQVVRAGGGFGGGSGAAGKADFGLAADEAIPRARVPKLVRIEGIEEFRALTGYYLRIPNTAAEAYGDVIQQCEGRGAVWAGNKVVLIASDLISTAFQFEIRLDQLITTEGSAGPVAGGAVELSQPLQALFEGLYFPVPSALEPFLVPAGGEEVRIEVRCDWIDFTSARAWEAAQSA